MHQVGTCWILDLGRPTPCTAVRSKLTTHTRCDSGIRAGPPSSLDQWQKVSFDLTADLGGEQAVNIKPIA